MMFKSNTRGVLLSVVALMIISQPATGQVTSLDTILSTTCDGTIRMFPDNQLMNVNVDAPFIPRMFGKFVDGIRTYVQTKCGTFYNETLFDERFDIGRFMLVGNKWFQGIETRSDACLDDPTLFTRDGYKMYGVLFPDQMEYDMPSTCDWNTWDRNGSCAFEYSVRGIQDTTLQVRIERCSRYGGGFPRLSVGCRGSGCSGMTPCASSSVCGAGQVCTDLADFIGKDNLRSALVAVGYYKDDATAGDPRQLIETFIAAFGDLFPGGVRTGSSVCLPKAIGNFNFDLWSWWWYPVDLSLWKKITTTFGGAWGSNEVTDYTKFTDCNTVDNWIWRLNETVNYATKWVLTEGLMNPWSGLVNGTNPLEPKSNWVTIPNVVYPKDEDHLLSVQCDGVIHAFAGSAFPIRIYHPKLSDLVEFWTAQNMAAYPLSDETTYLENMAIWRVDPYLYTMQKGSNGTRIGNILNIWQPDFHLNTNGESWMFDINNWRVNKTMSASIGLLSNGKSNPFGDDFRANIRAAQCPGQATGLTSVHVTCVGEVCREFLLKQPCMKDGDCSVGKCETLNGYYNNDYVAQILWGVDDSSIPSPWAGSVTCAAGESPGSYYSKLTTEQPVRGMLNDVWTGMQYANCDGRAAEKCVSECKMSGADCVSVNGVPPRWDFNVGFCFPDIANVTNSDIYSVKEEEVTFKRISSASVPEYLSEEVVVEPFPEPTHPVPEPHREYAGIETVLTGSCDGQFRLFPENELLAVSIDAQIVPRVFGEYMKAVDRHVAARCEAKGKTPPRLSPNGDGRFMKRFHPLSYLVYSGMVDEYDSCLDDSDTFVRDFLKLFKDNMFNVERLFLPSTCNNVTWFEQGSCKMKIPLRFIPDASVTVNIERCDTNYGYIRFAVGCEGGGCNSLGNPCNEDSDCGGHSSCVNPIEEIGAKKVFDFFRDTLHYLGPQATQSDAVQKLFNDFVTQFGKYFKGSPVPGVGNKKVCFPKKYTHPRDHNDDDIKNTVTERVQNDELICGMNGAVYQYYYTPYAPFSPLTANFFNVNPSDLPASGGASYPSQSGTFTVMRGHNITDAFMRPNTVGGGECVTHDDCSTDSVDIIGLCMSSYDMCNVSSNCNNPEQYSNTDYKCACSVGPIAISDRNDSSHYPFYDQKQAFGPMCQTVVLNEAYTIYRYSKYAVPDIPTFTPWDGILKDGKTQFQRGDEWPQFPEVRIPSGETHVMSVQCDGLITFFEGTPFAIRIYLPKKQELLQFIADKYIASMSSWIPVGLDPSEAFNRDQAPWRPEMFLSRFLPNTQPFPEFSSIVSGLSNTVLGLGGFTYSKFMEGKESGVGISYSGMKYVMGNDFKANVRFQQCAEYPNGLVGMDVTCVGEICSSLQLKTPCATGSKCLIGKCTSTRFYNNDIMAEALWGTNDDRFREFGGDWAGKTTCPSRIGMGSIGVHEVNNTKLFQTGASLYSLVASTSCSDRPQCACEDGCKWNGTSCLSTTSVDPKWYSEEINMCLPDLFPFPRAFIQDMGYSTGQIGKPNSSNIYSVSNGVTRGMNVTVYGVDADVEVIAAAVKQNYSVPDFSCDAGGSGSGTDTKDSGIETGEVVLIIAAAVVGVGLISLAGMFFTKKGPFRSKFSNEGMMERWASGNDPEPLN